VLYTPDEVLASKIGTELKALLIEKWEAQHKTEFVPRDLKFYERLDLLRKQEAIENPLREAALQELFQWTRQEEAPEEKHKELTE
jgi:hypothetical protein